MALSVCEAVVDFVAVSDSDVDDEDDTVTEKVPETESRLSVAVSEFVTEADLNEVLWEWV